MPSSESSAAHTEPRLRPPTRLERLAFRITRRWPDSYVAARLNYADELQAAALARWERYGR